MRLFKAGLVMGILLLLFIGWQFFPANQSTPVRAQSGSIGTATPQAARPSRKTKINYPFTSYKWWLNRYSNNQIVCAFSIEHDGLPTANDIYTLCSAKVYNEWITTVPCNPGQVSGLNECPGFYLMPIS
ncbi:MAG TPA: hypothetical protein VF806_02515, partial [Anaerolineaceae bacterium]